MLKLPVEIDLSYVALTAAEKLLEEATGKPAECLICGKKDSLTVLELMAERAKPQEGGKAILTVHVINTFPPHMWLVTNSVDYVVVKGI